MRGRSSSVLDRNILLRRLESCNKRNKLSVNEIVDNLRSNYPDYRRIKLQPFTKFVQKTIEFRQRASTSNLDNEDEDFIPFRSPVRKKLKKIGQMEEKLLRAHSSSSSDDSSEEEEDGGVSTSEDAIYETKVEPEFDLMKSMLRSSYSASKKIDSKIEDEEKNLEVEMVNKERRIDFVEGGRSEEREKGKLTDSKGSGGGFEVKGKDGPRFRDLGGMKSVLDELMMEVIIPLYHPHLPRWLGVKPMAGILLHGPPGCGKTKLAHAIANETGVPFYKISATEVVSGVSGKKMATGFMVIVISSSLDLESLGDEMRRVVLPFFGPKSETFVSWYRNGASEENIRDLFSKAYRTAPSIIFIDEIDAIASKRESLQREMERRIVTQLMTCMDESHQVIGSGNVELDTEKADQRPGYVLVIGATNRPDAVDPALRRPGRFDREIVLGVPDENARVEILSVITHNLRLEGTFDLGKIARSTPGFVGADLAALANKAGNLAMKRIIDRRKSELSRESKDEDGNEEWWKHPWVPEEMERLSITMADFEEAAKMVQPSSRREGFSTIPNVKWEDVGGLDLLRKEFDRYIVRRIKHPEDYEEFGVDLESGFLLYGPPGCGKTLIAKAVANEAGANFIHIKGPELLTKYVGESELAVRTIFSRARTCSPCILFFDEVDALTTKRGKEGGWVVERLLNQLLIELDGADQRRGVFVIGATNRPEVMDNAILRPGRFGKLIYVPLPGPDERGLILKTLARKKPVNADVDFIAIGRKEACENLSGADLAAVINEAAMAALEEKLMLGNASSDMMNHPWTIKTQHFERALEKISPSVSHKQKCYYKTLSQNFRAA